ncbi:hypothetical protein B0H19DRAFT_1068578 [Mycena capillaripes]|nr:hypothetical protein B0H19DRAFT_1068578 [Mycena capillaripes]
MGRGSFGTEAGQKMRRKMNNGCVRASNNTYWLFFWWKMRPSRLNLTVVIDSLNFEPLQIDWLNSYPQLLTGWILAVESNGLKLWLKFQTLNTQSLLNVHCVESRDYVTSHPDLKRGSASFYRSPEGRNYSRISPVLRFCKSRFNVQESQSGIALLRVSLTHLHLYTVQKSTLSSFKIPRTSPHSRAQNKDDGLAPKASGLSSRSTSGKVRRMVPKACLNDEKAPTRPLNVTAVEKTAVFDHGTGPPVVQSRSVRLACSEHKPRQHPSTRRRPGTGWLLTGEPVTYPSVLKKDKTARRTGRPDYLHHAWANIYAKSQFLHEISCRNLVLHVSESCLGGLACARTSRRGTRVKCTTSAADVFPGALFDVADLHAITLQVCTARLAKWAEENPGGWMEMIGEILALNDWMLIWTTTTPLPPPRHSTISYQMLDRPRQCLTYTSAFPISLDVAIGDSGLTIPSASDIQLAVAIQAAITAEKKAEKIRQEEEAAQKKYEAEHGPDFSAYYETIDI